VEFAESARAVQEFADEQGFPSPTDDLERSLHVATDRLLGHAWSSILEVTI
jgi:hypothetical protein